MYIKAEKTSDDEEDDISDLLHVSKEDEVTSTSKGQGHTTLMFHTPSFGEDDFDFLQQDKPAVSINSNNQTVSVDLTPPTSAYTQQQTISSGQHILSTNQQPAKFIFTEKPSTFSTAAHLSSINSNNSVNFHRQNFNFRQTVPDLQMTSKMTTHRDSILDTLESIAPKFPPQNLDLPDINVTHGLHMPVSNSILSSGFKPFSSGQMYGQTSLSTPVTQVTPGVNTISPSGSTVSPLRESSEDSDDSVPLAQLVKRQAQEDPHPVKPTPKPTAAKKARTPKKKKKKDPNEPQKPVSAYALFFRDTQAAIKGQNPNATFGEVSKIVASMWEGLDPEHKGAYKKRTDMAKKEYLKLLAAYRASLVSQTPVEDVNMSPSPPHRSPLGTSPQHMIGYTSPQHMGSPAHLMANNPAHMASSPAHIPSPHHVTSPQHMSSPAHMTSPGHVSSPQHNTIFNFNSQPQQQNQHVFPPEMGGYSNGPLTDMLDNHTPVHMNSQHLPNDGTTGRMIAAGMCIRNGCHNRAIDNIGWDCEYCSNECVVSHCRDVFTAWVANRQVPSNCFTVK